MWLIINTGITANQTQVARFFGTTGNKDIYRLASAVSFAVKRASGLLPVISTIKKTIAIEMWHQQREQHSDIGITHDSYGMGLLPDT